MQFKINFKKLMALGLTLILIAVSSLTALSLSWNGTTTGGGGGGTAAGKKGYAIRSTGDNCIGYRFSIVDKNGNNKVAKVIDVFRNTTAGNAAYSANFVFTVKYNKKQIMNNQNGNFSTARTTANCYTESTMWFATALSTPNTMETWQNNTTNLNRILSTLGAGSIADLKNGDKILVEPIYDVRLESVYHSLTVSEIAIYGKHILGIHSDGGASNTAQSWGFISNYTNKVYPNSLYTTDGMWLWSNASALARRATFNTIINAGYGVGIAYTETKPDFSPALSVNRCEAWPGSTGQRNNNHYGVSTGATFSHWTYGNSYPVKDSSIWYVVYFPGESQDCYVRQTVSVDGGGTVSRNVWLNSNEWYELALDPTIVPNDYINFTIKARIDWIDAAGNVLKYGAEKYFYIPIRPEIIAKSVEATAIDGYSMAIANAEHPTAQSAVYLGQRVANYYTYESLNSWVSYNRLKANMLRFSGSYADEISGDDMYREQAGIISSTPFSAGAGYYRIRKLENDNLMIRHDMLSAWESDTAHTTKSTSYNIPISIPDVAITDIKLIDENGYYADISDLEVNQKLTVQHRYVNNDDVRVYVEGHANGGGKTPIYGINPGESIVVEVETFTVPNKRSFTIEGAVYLEGYTDTSCESNGKNNRMVIGCKSNHPLKLYPITPNIPYRETTDVVSAFLVENVSNDDYHKNITAEFKAFNADKTITYHTETKENVVVPANEVNIIYIKWNVPRGAADCDINVSAELYEKDTLCSNSVILNTAIPYVSYGTADTNYEDSMPESFSYSAATSTYYEPKDWYEWKYEDGEFVAEFYYSYAKIFQGDIEPATGDTHYYENIEWHMKSGYGIKATVIAAKWCETPENSCTAPQYVTAYFPENMYLPGADKTAGLKRDGINFEFADSPKGNVHFTPIWFPDKPYVVKFIATDCWTPLGAISCEYPSNRIFIEGNMYDDWHVGRVN